MPAASPINATTVVSQRPTVVEQVLLLR